MMTSLIFLEFLIMTNVTLITGDGTGPELAQATRRCIDATGADINWDIQKAGVEVMAMEGTPLPQKTINSIKKLPSR
jgi:isocitrate dehydrogenase (NAD+)